ncbi:MAG TPA: dTMP kinase [Azospirillaceae bacterium]|nr:dTMP kinase [Azospirillaceae bacterium]
MQTGTRPGRFITFEGGEGAGKSTQVRRLVDALRAKGIDVVATREPGGSPGAEDIRQLLVTGDPGRWDPVTEAFLHFAARRDHLARTVWPALDRGAWVVSDRFADSTLAYQGYGHGLGRDVIERLYAAAVGDFRPDLTVLLDIPVEQGLQRAAGRAGQAGGSGPSAAEDRYERMDRGFHERLRAGFLDMAAREPARFVVVDARRDADAVWADVIAAVEQRLGR